MLNTFTSPHDSDILKLAVPALAGLAADPLVSLVDTAFVGQLGSTELGALGVNASIFSMAFVVFNFLAYATTPKVGQAVGNDNLKEAGKYVVRAMTLAVGLGVAAIVFLQVLADPILWLMGATGKLHAPALEYLRVRALAGPAILLINAGRGAFRGFQDTKTPMYITIVFNLVNLALDPLLIFVAGLGLQGAALATVVAQWTGAGIFVYLLVFSRAEKYGGELRLPSVEKLKPFIRVGGEMFVRTFSLIATMTIATAVAARVGVVAVAAHQVANQLWLFLALVVDSLAVAGQALVSKNLGKQQSERARAISDRLLQWGLVVGIMLGIGFYGLRPWLPGFFSDDPETIQRIYDIFIFVTLLQPLNGLVFVWDGIFMGAEAFSFLAKAMVISALAAGAVLLLVVPMGWGLAGVWWGISTLMLARLVTLAIPYYRGDLFDTR